MAITITLSDKISERVTEVAAEQQQNVVELVEEMLDAALTEQTSRRTNIDGLTEILQDDPEMAAYIKMHPLLKRRFLGAYVAIFQGELIDQDLDHAALYARVDQRYPDDYVWISKVEDEPIKTLRFPSPRFESGTPT